ncbi:hypothetical protein FAZ15_02600 [Sphingobacterium olei]|uniref:Uncharacterized protein n=1 Tax=Sphingobacterium olei TaxID=2571155 RepID=A0A4U0P6V4_9SPHI|nr:hypothetical protein [Sphingobacterium olei]TJZ63201.1 hypothetical protein FAZ15_02600 [Sphingobacterium olei]
MTTLQTNAPWSIQDMLGEIGIKQELGMLLLWLFTLFLFAGRILQLIDPTAGIMDVGILSVLILGLLGGLLSIFCSLWLQELLWQPFNMFRKHLGNHFNQLTSWQQCILYFSVFFLVLYALLWALAIAM